MKRVAILLGLALFLVSVVTASEDLTGKWSGSFIITSSDGETKDELAYMVLKQNGTELTGTAGPNAETQWPIQKGKVEGNKVTFEVQSNEPVIKFDLKLVDGHLKGEAKAEHEGKSMKAAVDVQRKAE
jgi:hypothetical protein